MRTTSTIENYKVTLTDYLASQSEEKPLSQNDEFRSFLTINLLNPNNPLSEKKEIIDFLSSHKFDFFTLKPFNLNLTSIFSALVLMNELELAEMIINLDYLTEANKERHLRICLEQIAITGHFANYKTTISNILEQKIDLKEGCDEKSELLPIMHWLQNHGAKISTRPTMLAVMQEQSLKNLALCCLTNNKKIIELFDQKIYGNLAFFNGTDGNKELYYLFINPEPESGKYIICSYKEFESLLNGDEETLSTSSKSLRNNKDLLSLQNIVTYCIGSITDINPRVTKLLQILIDEGSLQFDDQFFSVQFPHLITDYLADDSSYERKNDIKENYSEQFGIAKNNTESGFNISTTYLYHIAAKAEANDKFINNLKDEALAYLNAQLRSNKAVLQPIPEEQQFKLVAYRQKLSSPDETNKENKENIANYSNTNTGYSI